MPASLVVPDDIDRTAVASDLCKRGRGVLVNLGHAQPAFGEKPAALAAAFSRLTLPAAPHGCRGGEPKSDRRSLARLGSLAATAARFAGRTKSRRTAPGCGGGGSRGPLP